MAAIPELGKADPRKIRERTAAGYLLLLARSGGEVAGFKLGYPLSGRVFYSWIGGIRPEFRRQGVARQLLERQEEIVRERGYSMLRMKSMNRFPAMLRLLIAAGHQIIGVEDEGEPAKLKVVFEKILALN